jgi:hypothetical protein
LRHAQVNELVSTVERSPDLNTERQLRHRVCAMTLIAAPAPCGETITLDQAIRREQDAERKIGSFRFLATIMASG